MKILVACEESQIVCKALRAKGHLAYSCDLQECSGGHPEWHIQADAVEEAYSGKYDMMIAHPPCTKISRAGARWMYPKAGVICEKRYAEAVDAKNFFIRLLMAPIPKIAVENPTPLRIVGLPRHSQAIEPYHYGHPYSKRTLLWLKGLPFLKPTEILTEHTPFLPSNTGGAKRGQKFTYINISQKDSSKTFQGIANAMADQWTGDRFYHEIFKLQPQ